jgi:hypothetical protein
LPKSHPQHGLKTNQINKKPEPKPKLKQKPKDPKHPEHSAGYPEGFTDLLNNQIT